MGATSMGLPFIFMPAGPMLKGNASGKTLGSGSDMFKGWQELRAGTIDDDQWEDLLSGIARSPGHCMTMGTASTMTSAAEALGLTLPGAASIPAPDSRHAQMATQTGKRIVEMVWEDLTPAKILTDEAFDNAVTTVLALGGSTNALVHLVAMARRAGCSLDLDRFDELARTTPLIANLRPAGKYLMEDFYYAGGLRALLERIRDKLHTGALTVNGKTLGENIAGARVFNDDVILPRREGPVPGRQPRDPARQPGARRRRDQARGLRGAAASSTRARRWCSRTTPTCTRASTIRTSTWTRTACWCCKNAGPLGGPGMPEWGQLPIPKKLLQKGVRDMVRISDARMSGTSFGACVLHVAPESFIGGPLALVQDGDLIELDIPARKLQLHVSDAELERRRAAWKAPAAALRARLRRDLRAARDAGERGLRLRGARQPLPRSRTRHLLAETQHMDTPIGLTGHSLIGSGAAPGAAAGIKGIDPATGPGARALLRRCQPRRPGACLRTRRRRVRHLSRDDARAARAHSSRRSPRTSSRSAIPLIVRAMQESGLPRARLEGERGRTMNQLKLFAEVVREGSWLEARIDPAMPDRKPLPRSDLRVRNVPVRSRRGVRRQQLPARLLRGRRRHRLRAGGGLPGHREGASRASGHLRAGRPRRSIRCRRNAACPRACSRCSTARATRSAPRSSPMRASRPWASPARAAAGTALMKVANARPEPIPVYAEMSSINPVLVLPHALAVARRGDRQGVHRLAHDGRGPVLHQPGPAARRRGRGARRLRRQGRGEPRRGAARRPCSRPASTRPTAAASRSSRRTRA